jgi:hypothetical protein
LHALSRKKPNANLNTNRYMYYIVRSWYLAQHYQKLMKHTHTQKIYMQIVTQIQQS